ncbi:MAG: nucleoside 2-deoxyribosyltransferase [Caulobacteraceae bacterium]|nr:nucleoside 2-deoxyribosyltransferase [Caulobacteraceae bacterium]
MRRIASIYLAGPDAWFPDAVEHDLSKRALCQSAGFRAVTAFDNETSEGDRSEVLARELYAETARRLRQSDALIANLTPWRGPGCDPATAFAVGFMAALGKPVFAYLNVAETDEADYRERVERRTGASPDPAGVWRDVDGAEVEDFGLPESLLLWVEARGFFLIVTPEPMHELAGLELALEAVRAYAA